MIVLGALFPEEQEQQIIKKSKGRMSNAGNGFQWKVIKGLDDNDTSMVIINVLPVGIWPSYYKDLVLKDRRWRFNNHECYEVGCINLPLLKQLSRMLRIRKILRNYKDEKEILIFTAYLPFLWAASSLRREQNVTALITDIPEFYDLHKVTWIRKEMRVIHNKIVYHFMGRVNRFILLTEQMRVPLRVGDRPWMLMEGICDISDKSNKAQDNVFSVLYSGRLNRRYGLEELLQAFEQIEDDEIELWICGSGEMTEEISELANKDKRIKFHGFVSHSEAIQLQQNASVLINPRFNNEAYTKYSFPSKTLEYMEAGKPVVMFKLDGIPEEYNSFLTYIPEETVESIKDTLLQLRAMPKERLEKIGEESQKFVRQHKNRTIQAKRIKTFLEDRGNR